MALVTTILTVMAMLGGIAALLWLTTVIEARRLGPVGLRMGAPDPALAEALAEPVESVQTAA